MFINIDYDIGTIRELEHRAAQAGTSRTLLMKYIADRFLAMPYPIEDFKFICPDCVGGRKHCGGGVRDLLDDKDNVDWAGRKRGANSFTPRGYGNERRLRWICTCKVCTELKETWGRPSGPLPASGAQVDFDGPVEAAGCLVPVERGE